MSAAALASASAAVPTATPAAMAPIAPDRPPCIALLSRVLDLSLIHI